KWVSGGKSAFFCPDLPICSLEGISPYPSSPDSFTHPEITKAFAVRPGPFPEQKDMLGVRL
ncbi:hypothetical protein N9891_02155, partial [bacterium]|nr:hypothetical protein [bacterium]